jgi:hypothetical protein
MKKYIYNIVIVAIYSVLFIGLYIIVSSKLLSKFYGQTTKQQIEQQFANLTSQRDSIECIYLGSSKFYRGINPHLITPCGYNFAHDNDSYNQIYYKLLYADQCCPRLKRVVVCFDYVSFCVFSETRNYVYHRYFSKEYSLDYSNNFYNNYIYPYLIGTKNLPKIILSYFDANRPEPPYLTDKGQFVTPGKAQEDDYVKYCTYIYNLQVSYFNKIVKYCLDHHLECVLVAMPNRDGEYWNYDKAFIDKMNNLALNAQKQYSCFYLNYIRDKELLDVSLFCDVSHFNQYGADLFSRRLNVEINRNQSDNL